MPTCTDGVQNGTETDLDCGGTCAPMQACDAGKMCVLPTDCKSSDCTGMLCQPGGCHTCWKVQYQYVNRGTDRSWSEQKFNIVKTGTSTDPLSNLKIRYWFAAKRSAALTSSIFSFPAGGSTVTATFKAVTPPRMGADTYLEIGFTSGANWSSGQSGVVDMAFHFNDWSTFTFPNGYSCDTTFTTLKDAPKVTLYDQPGNLVWGTEPPACAAGDAGACP